MLPRDIGSIPTSALQAGATEFWNFVRFDFDTPLYLTDCPGGFVGDIGDGSGSQTWVGGKLVDVGPSSQGSKNPLTVDEIQVDNSDNWWTSFILGAADGVYDFGVSTFIGWFDSSGDFIDAYEDFVGYTDAISALYVARIALKSQTTAHGKTYPDDYYTHAQFPTMPSADDVLQWGTVTSKQPSAAAWYINNDIPLPPTVPGGPITPPNTVPFDYTNSNADRSGDGTPPPPPPSSTITVPLQPADPKRGF